MHRSGNIVAALPSSILACSALRTRAAAFLLCRSMATAAPQTHGAHAEATNTPFHIKYKQGQARAGTLYTSRGALPTPNAFFYSKKANFVHLTPDLLQHVPDVRSIHVPVPELVAAPGVDGLKSFKDGLHDYAQLQKHLMYMSVRDPLVDTMGTSNENGVSVLAQQGTTRVSPAQYGALAAAYAPDIVASISDEVPSTVASNRARKASQRSVMWCDDMQRAITAANPSKRPLFFATIQGGADLEQRRISCLEYARRAALGDAAANGPAAASAARVDGFVISGLGSGEDVTKRDEVIAHVVKSLPSDKPRVLSSSSCLHGSPEEVLRAVAQGVDLFEVEYPHQLTLLGQASVFAITESDDPERALQHPELPVTKLHLRDARYAHDQSPILKGCTCYTCKNHTRAYLHHLLNVHEMTAPILLDLHNLHHYSRFLSAIRSSLSSDDGGASFESFRLRFLAGFLPSSGALAAPAHRNQVGRALLGPFAPVLAEKNGFVLRRILPKDDAQIAAIVREVLPTFGGVGPGFASADPELDCLYRAFELAPVTEATPQAGASAEDVSMTDASAAAAAPAAAAASPFAAAPAPAPSTTSGYFVVTRADDDSVVLGGGGVMPLKNVVPSAGERICELQKLYFLPALRGQGMGHLLLEHAMQLARSLGYTAMYLESLHTMKAAMRLYEQNGFKEIEGPMGNTGHFSCDKFYLKQL